MNNIVNFVDRSTDAKYFQLHCCYLLGTWIVDEYVINGEHFVICTEGNTRNLKVYYMHQGPNWIKPKRNVYSAIDLEQMLMKFWKISIGKDKI